VLLGSSRRGGSKTDALLEEGVDGVPVPLFSPLVTPSSTASAQASWSCLVGRSKNMPLTAELPPTHDLACEDKRSFVLEVWHRLRDNGPRLGAYPTATPLGEWRSKMSHLYDSYPVGIRVLFCPTKKFDKRCLGHIPRLHTRPRAPFLLHSVSVTTRTKTGLGETAYSQGKLP
jgi:hypothetical protein